MVSASYQYPCIIARFSCWIHMQVQPKLHACWTGGIEAYCMSYPARTVVGNAKINKNERLVNKE